MTNDQLGTDVAGTTPFDWSDEQQEIRSLLRKKFATLGGAELARTALEWPDEAAAASDSIWRNLCDEIGLAGLTLPEEFGGMGCGRIELAIVAEEMGRALIGGPYLSTVVLAAEAVLASKDVDAARALMPGIVDGSLTAALAAGESSTEWGVPTTTFIDGHIHGVKNGVVGAVGADQLVVSVVDESGRESLALVDVEAAGSTVTVTPKPALDASRTVATISFENVPARLLGVAGAAREVLGRVRETAAIFLAAEQAGGSRTCIEITAEYARTRIQFGQKIGRFQGVKHRLADMEVRTAQAHSASVWAAWAEPGSPDAAMGAAVTRVWCTESYLQNAFDMIQLHGGIGITWEHDAHLFLRRAQADAALLGPLSLERARLAAGLAAGLEREETA